MKQYEKKINIATNQSLNLSPIVSTLGLFFYCLQSLQMPFTTTSVSLGVNPFGNLTSGTNTSSRQRVLPHLMHIK